MSSITAQIHRTLSSLGDPAIAEHSAHYFKAIPGGYGEGDKFLGIRVPVIRAQVRQYPALSLADIKILLTSEFHEVRLFALLWLVQHFAKADEKEQTAIYRLYMAHLPYINNWDLIDSSAPKIVGPYLAGRDRNILYKFVKSRSKWHRRIAVLACFYFIAQHDFEDALNIARQLVNDNEDLIHKAAGWMLREIGKRDMVVEEGFLREYYQTMPRTMLRYAIEQFPERKRNTYLRDTIKGDGGIKK